MTACLSDLRLDEILAGERPGDDHLAGCAACQARADALAGDRDRFHAARPRPTAIADRAARPRVGEWRRAARLAGACLAVAAAALVVSRPRAGDPGTRTKGGAHLGFAVQHAGAQRLGATGEVVHPGDTLTYLVTTAAPAHVTVLGRDAAGRVTTYAVEHVAAGRDLQLATATQLDGSLGPEALVAVFCAAPTIVAPTAIDAPPAGCTIDRLVLEKAPDRHDAPEAR